MGWDTPLQLCLCFSEAHTTRVNTQTGARHLPVLVANSQDASTSPSFTLCTRSPSPSNTRGAPVLRELSGLGDRSMPPPVVTSLGVEPLDTTWSGGQSSPSQDSHSHSRQWGWARQYRPHRARLAHPRKRRLAARRWGGGAPQNLGLQSPARCTSLASRAPPPYLLEAPGVVARGPWEIPWTPVPGGARFARSPSTPPRAVPGGAAPWSGEAGAVCCGSCDLSRSCVSQPPHPCRSCAGDPGSPVPLGCEPPTPGLSRPARHGQRPPSPLAAAPTRAPAAA